MYSISLHIFHFIPGARHREGGGEVAFGKGFQPCSQFFEGGGNVFGGKFAEFHGDEHSSGNDSQDQNGQNPACYN